jgi:hypothetical protein
MGASKPSQLLRTFPTEYSRAGEATSCPTGKGDDLNTGTPATGHSRRHRKPRESQRSTANISVKVSLVRLKSPNSLQGKSGAEIRGLFQFDQDLDRTKENEQKRKKKTVKGLTN